MFGGMMKALKAPVNAVKKLPGMGAATGAVGKAVPGAGGMMGKMGLGPSPQAMQGIGGMAQNVAGAAGMMQKPPLADSMAPLQQGPSMDQAPPMQGQSGVPNTGGPDMNSMMALKQQAAGAGGGMGIGPSFGQAPPQGQMSGKQQMRNRRMM